MSEHQKPEPRSLPGRQLHRLHQPPDLSPAPGCGQRGTEEEDGLGGGEGEEEARLSLSQPFADQVPRDLGVLWHGGFQRAEDGVLVQPDCHPRL